MLRTDIDISPKELTILKTLAQKATPERWQPSFVAGCVTIGQNQVYIAAAHPGVLLAMCEEIERLRAEVARLEKEADWLATQIRAFCKAPALSHNINVCYSICKLYPTCMTKDNQRAAIRMWREAARKAVEENND